MGKKKDSDKIIHIHAKCEQFEIFEHQPENKAEARLKQIRELYLKSCTKGEFIPARRVFGKRKKKKFHRLDTNRLIVNTVLVNPTLI
jgi:hypothetical protein